MKKSLKVLLRSHMTVFSFKDLRLLWSGTAQNVMLRVSYYIKRGELYHIRRGFYAKDKNYDRYELATKIYTPAYISFETVLISSGINFQYYSQIFVASYQTRSIICDGQTYTYKKLKASILLNPDGIEKKENYSIASTERAFLDILYIHKDYYFDNLSPLNWKRVFEILPIYENKRMAKVVNRLYEQALADKE